MILFTDAKAFIKGGKKYPKINKSTALLLSDKQIKVLF